MYKFKIRVIIMKKGSWIKLCFGIEGYVNYKKRELNWFESRILR